MEEKKPRGTRTGFTTGACTAAAARAATLGLLHGQVPDTVECQLPNGQLVLFTITEGRVDGNTAHAVVIKDAGDDPDCTHGAHMTVDVRLLPGAIGVVLLKGGHGVGTITMPGLGLQVGGPAINPVPRRNIEENVRIAAGSLLELQGLEVTIIVPGGIEMSKKTLNDRLGIISGISILGTTGIVKPYSTSAFRASVIQGIQVAKARGQDTVVLTTGGRTEKFVMKELSHLPSTCFIQMGDFLGYALDTVVSEKLTYAVIGGMVGKLTKMAQGETMTHAGRAEVNTDLLAGIAAELGVSAELCNEIRNNETARYAGEVMESLGLSAEFHLALAQRVVATIAARYPRQFHLKVLVCDFDGNKIAEAEGNI